MAFSVFMIPLSIHAVISNMKRRFPAEAETTLLFAVVEGIAEKVFKQ